MSELPQGSAAHVYSPDTVCPSCRGNHEISISRLGVTEGVGSTMNLLQECPQCDGDGRLTGFQPPM
ncbi:hypothetical protein [Longimycelium tulufanense]|nr:hypothetical protein [Longimycelium tulufanense]